MGRRLGTLGLSAKSISKLRCAIALARGSKTSNIPVMIVMGTLAIFASSVSVLRLASDGSLLPSAATSIGGPSSSSSIVMIMTGKVID